MSGAMLIGCIHCCLITVAMGPCSTLKDWYKRECLHNIHGLKMPISFAFDVDGRAEERIGWGEKMNDRGGRICSHN
jgi:hypothetical protein